MLDQQRARGFTIVEILIALVIGLVLIAGTMGIFLSNQQSAAVKRDHDNAQETLRFVSYTISRMVRNAKDLSVSDDELIVTFDRGPGIRDCQGLDTVANGLRNTFTWDESVGRLRCEGATIAHGLTNISFTGVPDSEGELTSVVTDLKMISGLGTTFTATARNRVIALYGGKVTDENNGIGNPDGDGNSDGGENGDSEGGENGSGDGPSDGGENGDGDGGENGDNENSDTNNCTTTFTGERHNKGKVRIPNHSCSNEGNSEYRCTVKAPKNTSVTLYYTPPNKKIVQIPMKTNCEVNEYDFK